MLEHVTLKRPVLSFPICLQETTTEFSHKKRELVYQPRETAPPWWN